MLIGPDHLVFGLAKDCINVVLSLLPKESYISEFEEIALSSLRQARLRTQGKLVNMQKKTLFSMTISEVFALLQISEYCFHVSVMKNERLQLSSNATTVSELCKKTIKVLGSLAAVAARLWFTPRLDEDGKEIVREFNNVHGTTYLRKTQTIIHDHIKLMREVASYDDEEAREYHSLKGTGGNVLQKKRKIEKSLRETNIVLKMLDKPNVHRLLELAYFMLPMVGSATRIAELEFERGHQAMKRAVENSNQHQPHVDAVSAAIFNDWRGRLSMLLRGDDSSQCTKLSLARILFGRDLIRTRNGLLNAEDEIKLQTAIGPNFLVQRLFQMQNAKVLNEEASVTGSSFWEGVNRESDIPRSIALSGAYPFLYSVASDDFETAHLTVHYELIVKRAIFLLQQCITPRKWQVLDRVYAKHHNSDNAKNETELRPGDIIQVNSLPWNDLVPVITTYDEEMGPVDTVINYFYVICLYTVECANGAVVLPCEAIERNQNEEVINEPKPRIQIKNQKLYAIRKGLNEVKLLNLSRSCQRVLAQHQCSPQCSIAVVNSIREFYHDEHPLNSQFYIRSRSSGFPPRSA